MEVFFSTVNDSLYTPRNFSKSTASIGKTFQNPTASSDTQLCLLALKQFDDAQNDKNYIFEIPYGSIFRIDSGKIFKKMAVRVKRFECLEVSSKNVSLIQMLRWNCPCNNFTAFDASG
jgi:translation elongation factor EF-G